MNGPNWHVPLAEIMATIEGLPPDQRFTYPIRHGSMRVGIYAPRKIDDQTPHDQDELYIIASGHADFIKDGQRIGVKDQDLLFVEAGADHHFACMSTDFAAWVIFWGPPGGEQDKV